MEISRKIEKMAKTVLNDAIKKRDETIERSKKIVDEALYDAEVNALKIAYEKIQEHTHKSQIEKQKKISKASFESKKKLIKKRDEMENEILQNVINRIYEYKKTEEYKEWILNLCNESLESYKDIVVYIDKSDEGISSLLKAKNVKICDEGFIGGVRIYVPSKNIIIDKTYSRILKEEMDEFNELKIQW